MNKRILLAGIATLLAANCGYAATKVGAIGTSQMAGEWASFNKPYSLGSKGNKMNITLRSAEYTVGQVVIGAETYFPNKGEKLLVLHYTMQNPEKSPGVAGWSTFRFTAVDAEDANHSSVLRTGMETNRKELNMKLKPAQKVEAYTLIRVGADGETPKLIVQRGPGMVLRYDLRGKVKQLPAEYADPADVTGATVRTEISGKTGQYYHASDFDFKVGSIAVLTDGVGDRKPGKGKATVLVSCTVKNKSGAASAFSWTTVKPSLTMDSGTATWHKSLVDVSSLESINMPRLAPGQETAVGFIFAVKADTKPQKLVCTTKSGISYSFDALASE